jgi:DhnA family fructose-bisphosphate aldolase class Ia
MKDSLRERRLFRENDRALVVAMDHARALHTVTGLKDANAIIRTVMGAG